MLKDELIYAAAIIIAYFLVRLLRIDAQHFFFLFNGLQSIYTTVSKFV